MKRIICAIIATLLCLSAVACGSEKTNTLSGTYSVVIKGDSADWADNLSSSEEASESSIEEESSEESSQTTSFEISIEYPELSTSPSDSEADNSVDTQKTDVTISLTFEGQKVKVVMKVAGESVSREGSFSVSGSDIQVVFDGITYDLIYNAEDNSVKMGDLVLTK